jgi:HD superfamily phosphohydrolase
MSEQNNVDYKYSTINDAIHGVMKLPKEYKELIKDIVDSKEFQRLRHIKQMGLTEFIFPSATHNRFSHSLGAGYVAYKIIQSIGYDKDPSKELAAKYAIIGALLHDIGHGPFSHLFEHLFKNDEKGKNDRAISHEDWTQEMDVLNRLEAHGIEKDKLLQMIRGEYQSDPAMGELNIAAQIISSQLDADRLDYLLRDSYHCGVKYGLIDVDWIITHMAVEEKDVSNPPKLVVHEKATHALEHYLLARKMIYQNIALHHGSLVAEKLMMFLLKYSIEEVVLDFIKKNNLATKNLHKFLTAVSKYQNDLSISKQDFLSEYAIYYKELTDHDIWLIVKGFSSIIPSAETAHEIKRVHRIAKSLYERYLPEVFSFRKEHCSAVTKILADFRKTKSIDEWEAFIVDQKFGIYKCENSGNNIQKDAILIKSKRHGKISNFSSHSSIIEGISNKDALQYFLAVEADVWTRNQTELKQELGKYIDF